MNRAVKCQTLRAIDAASAPDIVTPWGRSAGRSSVWALFRSTLRRLNRTRQDVEQLAGEPKKPPLSPGKFENSPNNIA